MCLPSDALFQHLPSYLGFLYLGHGVALHGCSRKVQPLLLTLDEGCLLRAAPPDLECGIALHMDITRWSTLKSDWLYSLIQSAKTRLGADCGSYHDLLIAKFRLKLKKVEKTTRPFRCDLNQIPYDYTVEVRNRFKGLDLIDRVPDELWTDVHDIVQETGIKTIPMEKKCKKAKWLSGEALQIAVKRKEAKSKEEKERYTPWMQNSKE